jgi:hypothetical protein
LGREHAGVSSVNRLKTFENKESGLLWLYDASIAIIPHPIANYRNDKVPSATGSCFP